jgi:hypothetical protein
MIEVDKEHNILPKLMFLLIFSKAQILTWWWYNYGMPQDREPTFSLFIQKFEEGNVGILKLLQYSR